MKPSKQAIDIAKHLSDKYCCKGKKVNVISKVTAELLKISRSRVSDEITRKIDKFPIEALTDLSNQPPEIISLYAVFVLSFDSTKIKGMHYGYIYST